MPDPIIFFASCRPVAAHARLVMAWRNDPVTLSMSRHREPKRWESFWPEFRDVYFRVEAVLMPVFAVVGRRRIGFLRFVPVEHPLALDRRAVEISINIAPEWRGMGLGAAVLRATLNHLRDWDGDSVCAEAKEENVPSRKVFAVAGFREVGVVEKRIPDTGEVCRMVRFVFDLT